MAPAVLLLLALTVQDPVQVRARLTQSEVPAGETTTLRVEVETTGPRAQIQRFRTLPPGIRLEGTRDFDQRQFSIPGGTRRFITREFVLRPQAQGRYRIPSLDVIVEGQTYSTGPVLLTVGPSARRRADGGEMVSPGGDGVVLRTWLDADTVYVGEQVTMEAEAMFSQQARIRLRRAPEYEPPSPSGFWVQDVPVSSRPITRRANGELVEVQRFQRVFFPMEPGEYEIPPARLEYETRRGLLYAPETRELTSDPMPLVVLSVPEPRPSAFTGAVGSFTARARLDPQQVPAGEAAVLTVEVEGVGNIKTLPPPELPPMGPFEVFPPSAEATVQTEDGVVRGSKRFSWVLIPRETGKLTVPGISYPYFDPEDGRFREATVDPMTLEVTPGTAASELPGRPALRYLKTQPETVDPLGWVRSPWFATAQLLPLVLLAGGMGWRRRGRRGERPVSGRVLRRRRIARLRELDDRASQSDPELFTEAETFARQWLGDRLGIAPATAARPAALIDAGVDSATATHLGSLFDRLSAARYAPTPPDSAARRELLSSLAKLLESVDARAPRPRRTGAAATSLGSILGGCLIAAATTTAATATAMPAMHAPPTTAMTATAVPPGADAALTLQVPDAFEEGIQAFDQERYMEAAEAFDRHVRARPGDPAGWYNLGTAYHRAGYPGFAAWAWLKVPALDPRDRDVRHNLRVAGVPPELVDRVAPPFLLRSSELFLLASLLWLVAGAAGALWLARGRTAAGTTAGFALFLALVLAAAGWTSTRDSETLIVLENSTLRAAPTLRADPVAELEPGTSLVPVESRDDWVRARTTRGDEGWIEATTTGEI